jgi:hypothetical protein
MQASKSQKRMQELLSRSKGAIEKVTEWEGLYWTFDHGKGGYSAFDRKMHKMVMGNGEPMPDDLIITCGEDKSVAVWDLGTGELVRRMQGHQREITDLAIFKGHCPEGGRHACSQPATHYFLPPSTSTACFSFAAFYFHCVADGFY